MTCTCDEIGEERTVLELMRERDRYRSALEAIAEGDCSYGDECPTFGSRHGQCLPCQAREALAPYTCEVDDAHCALP